MRKVFYLFVLFVIASILSGCETIGDTTDLESRIVQLESDLIMLQEDLTASEEELVNINISLLEAQEEVLLAVQELELLQSDLDTSDEDLKDAESSLALAQTQLQNIQIELQQVEAELQTALANIELQKFNGTLGTTVLVEADEISGFSFPYILYYPSEVEGSTYLLVESYNAGSAHTTNDINVTIENAMQYGAITGPTIGAIIADRMDLPRIMPIIPRLAYVVEDQYGNIVDYGHPHGLDRTTMLIEDYISNVHVWPGFEVNGVTDEYFQKLIDVEQQVYNMIIDAQTKLIENNYECEDKIFITGYSASGSFSSRFTSFYPTKVKAMFSGGMHVPFVPATLYQTHDMIYGIGASDHLHINGKEFNLNDYNNVAKMMFLGMQDTNDPLPYSGVFSTDQRELAILLYGNDWHTRWNNVKDVFYEVGGTGLFVESESLGHAYSPELISLIEQFFTINIGTQMPNYTLDCQSDDLTCIIN